MTNILLIKELQNWYAKHCDGEWEHDFGIMIETTDNPGWWLKIDLKGTELETRTFASVSRPQRRNRESAEPWLECFVDDNFRFNGGGDPSSLEKILEVFLSWAGTSRDEHGDSA